MMKHDRPPLPDLRPLRGKGFNNSFGQRLRMRAVAEAFRLSQKDVNRLAKMAPKTSLELETRCCGLMTFYRRK